MTDALRAEVEPDELSVRLTSSLRVAIQAAVTGGVKAYVNDYPHAAGIGINSLSKRVAGQLWGVLKTHPDVRRVTESFPDELIADLSRCRTECGKKSQQIESLKARAEAAESRLAAVEAERDAYAGKLHKLQASGTSRLAALSADHARRSHGEDVEILLRWIESLQMATTREEAWLLTNQDQPKQADAIVRAILNELVEATDAAESWQKNYDSANGARRQAEDLVKSLSAAHASHLQQLRELVQEWRRDADELDEATRGQWVEPSVTRACADDLSALLASLPALGGEPAEPEDESLEDIARDLFADLCEGDGEHSEALDRALILKHLRRAVKSMAPLSGSPEQEAGSK